MNFEKVKKWYDRREVKFELKDQLFNRELAALVAKPEKRTMKSTRNLRCHNTQHFDIIRSALNMDQQEVLYQFYFSLARFKTGIPYQTLNFIDRKKEMVVWNSEAEYQIIDYLWIIDIDAKSHDDMMSVHEQALKIIEIIKKPETLSKIPLKVSCVFTGMGFHIYIHADEKGELGYVYTKNDHPSMEELYTPGFGEPDIYSLIKESTKHYFGDVAPDIDYSIYDCRRLAKLCYSLAIYGDKEIYVCYPFSSIEELKSFKLEDYSLDKFDKQIGYRGVPKF